MKLENKQPNGDRGLWRKSRGVDGLTLSSALLSLPDCVKFSNQDMIKIFGDALCMSFRVHKKNNINTKNLNRLIKNYFTQRNIIHIEEPRISGKQKCWIIPIELYFTIASYPTPEDINKIIIDIVKLTDNEKCIVDIDD
jgi:hypothetical protein